MSLMEDIRKLLNGKGGYFPLNIEAGEYPPESQSNRICGKVIFAGGIGLSEPDKPRNAMGGDVLRAEVFKVVLRGTNNYTDLEKALIDVKNVLNHAGYIQLSGFEHMEPMQLAVTFKSTKQQK